MNGHEWEECVRFHGHMCPGLAFGFRAATEAVRILGISRSEDEDVVCISESDGCGVDAVQCVLSCTAGKGNLIIRMTGKNAFSFFDRTAGKSIRIVAKRFERPGAEDRRRFTEHVLNAPFDSLFTVGDVRHGLPEKARIYDSAVCGRCGEAFRADLAQMSGGTVLCADCSLIPGSAPKHM
jgi:formylmethanofuran dehydrogenase subunit E